MKKNASFESNFAGYSQQVTNAIIASIEKAVAKCCNQQNIPAHDLMDIKQEACKNAFRSLRGFEQSKSTSGDYCAWAYKIAINCVRDYWEDRSKREGWASAKPGDHGNRRSDSDYDYEDSDNPCYVESDDSMTNMDSDPQSDLEKKEQMEWINKRLTLLDETKRTIVRKTLEGYKPKEIAEQMGCTPGNVSVNLCRAIKTLRGAA